MSYVTPSKSNKTEIPVGFLEADFLEDTHVLKLSDGKLSAERRPSIDLPLFGRKNLPVTTKWAKCAEKMNEILSQRTDVLRGLQAQSKEPQSIEQVATAFRLKCKNYNQRYVQSILKNYVQNTEDKEVLFAELKRVLNTPRTDEGYILQQVEKHLTDQTSLMRPLLTAIIDHSQTDLNVEFISMRKVDQVCRRSLGMATLSEKIILISEEIRNGDNANMVFALVDQVGQELKAKSEALHRMVTNDRDRQETAKELAYFGSTIQSALESITPIRKPASETMVKLLDDETIYQEREYLENLYAWTESSFSSIITREAYNKF